MKMVFTMGEVRQIVLKHAISLLADQPPNPPEGATANRVRFVHAYPDGSGTTEVDDIAPVDRVEVLIP